MPDYAAQRLNMVDSQIRPSGVTEPRLVAALSEVPRERFVPAAKRAAAYADLAVEVAPKRALLDPRSFARLAALADVRSTDRLLDVGCLTGYSSAVFARLAASVIALEEDADLVRVASDMLPAVGANAVTVTQGALADGFKARAPYDVIFVNGAVEQEPDSLLAQLAEGGRLVAIVQKSGAVGRGRLYVCEKGRIGEFDHFDASAAILPGFRKKPGFVF